MKAILEFNLPDDEQEYTLANNALNFWNVLYELDKDLREKIKYPSDEMTEDKCNTYQEVRDMLHELLNSYNISLDMVK